MSNLFVKTKAGFSGNLYVKVLKPTPQAYTDCLTFTGKTGDFTLKATSKDWDGTLEWSTDHNAWTTLAGTEAMQSANKKLYLRGKNTTLFKNEEGIMWQLSQQADCSGNIQTLLDWENPSVIIGTSQCYSGLFYGCTNLTSAPELRATTLSWGCYTAMFQGCTSLTSAPVLPATALAKYCYQGMFQDCTSLITAPELPATTLMTYCYQGMFQGCTSLTSAPVLPATALENACYQGMFQGCTSLITAPELPATTLKYQCYEQMFKGCTSLTTAPELRATTLANWCYQFMFRGCAKLKVNENVGGNKIFMCPTTIPTAAVTDMFTNTGGTFTGTPTAGNTYYWTN